jgi:hypothetical protein
MTSKLQLLINNGKIFIGKLFCKIHQLYKMHVQWDSFSIKIWNALDNNLLFKSKWL